MFRETGVLPVDSVACLKVNVRRSLNAVTRGDISDLGEASERGDTAESRLVAVGHMVRVEVVVKMVNESRSYCAPGAYR